MTTNTRLAAMSAALAAGFALAGCTTTPALVTSDGTVVVPAWSSVAVQSPPPAAVVETQGTAPYADAVWIPGYYTYSNGGYVWVNGRRDHTRAGYHWVPAAWEQRGEGWYYREGYWAR